MMIDTELIKLHRKKVTINNIMLYQYFFVILKRKFVMKWKISLKLYRTE